MKKRLALLVALLFVFLGLLFKIYYRESDNVNERDVSYIKPLPDVMILPTTSVPTTSAKRLENGEDSTASLDTEELYRLDMSTQANGAPLEVIGFDFKITPAGQRFFAISDVNADLITTYLTEFHEEMTAIAKNFVRPVREADDQVQRFKIVPFWNEAQQIFEKLDRQIKPLASKNPELLTSSLGLNNYFGDLGRRDVLLTFREVGETIIYEVEEFDPMSGKKLKGGSASFEGFSRHYGNILEIEQAP